MAHGITLGKLAKLAGVSPATVSIVLNRHPLASRIPEHTQEKIKQFAKLHNYFPNHLAKAMKQQSTGIIGFVCGDIAQPFYAELCSELTLAVERRGCRLMTMLTQWSFEKEIEALEQLFSNALDGAVIFSQVFTECNERSDRFRKPGIPLVTISDFNNIGVCRVASDFRPGMEALFELLTANGFTRISFCDFPQYQVKYEAYRVCADKFNIAAERFDLGSLTDDELGKIVDQIIHSGTEAVILASDYLATLFIPRFVRAGIRVPEDISIVSIDGTGWSQHYNPPLTAVRQDIPAIAEAALEILFNRIKGNSDIITSLIPTKLNIFHSVKLTTGEKS